MHVGRYRPEIIIRLLVAHIARAQNLLDLPGNQELLKLRRQVVYSVRDVQVANDEYEDHGAFGRDGEGDARGVLTPQTRAHLAQTSASRTRSRWRLRRVLNSCNDEHHKKFATLRPRPGREHCRGGMHISYTSLGNTHLRSQKCYVSLVENLAFCDTECLKTALSKGMGWGIVIGSGVMKLPQLYISA